MVSVLCFLESHTSHREPAGLTELLVSQALQQPLVLLQFVPPRERLGLLEDRRQMCNVRIRGMLLLPQLAKRQHFRAGNVLGFVLTLGKKGKKAKERKVCAVSDLTQQINIFLFNYLNRCWLPRTETLWRKEQLREQAQLRSVFSKAIGIQMIRP